MQMPRRKREHPMVPITSMGDIAFLLIIFFLVTSAFREQHITHLEQPQSIDIDEIEESAVSVVLDGDGQLWVQGKECRMDLLEAAVQAFLEGQDERVVMVRIDRLVPQETFGEVFMSLSSVGAEIALVGTRKEE